MLCCLESPFKDPATAYNAQTNNAGVTPFPGQRRPLYKTAGNALTAMPPGAPPSHASSMGSNGSAGQMISVTIPPGVSAGQSIQVAVPGSSRTISATIPHGMGPGQTFLVAVPPAASSPALPTAVPTSSTDLPVATAVPMSSSPVPSTYSSSTAPAAVLPFSQALDNPPPHQQQPTNISNMNDRPAPSAPQYTPQQPHNPPSSQKLILVNVPPGTAPGTTLHVQIPGEQRMLAAQVPPGVSQFHVTYEPQQQASPSPAVQAQALAPPCALHNNHNQHTSASGNGQTLLLVQVPPGTAPGTTLHVSVPGEPGRLIAAQVPPNAAEFHVAYEPAVSTSLSSPQGGTYRRSNSNNNNNVNRTYRNSNNMNGGMGSMLLPMMGGAAFGAAGMGMFDHYHHNGESQYNQQQQDNGGYGNDMDFGGGGGFDFGGGDMGGGDF